MSLNSCHPHRSVEDQSVLGKICFDTLCIKEKIKDRNNQFCFIFVEGRERKLNSYEDLAALKSCRVFSKYNYPIYIFQNRISFGANKTIFYDEIKNIYNIPINPINNRYDYSEFCKVLYHLIPPIHEYAVTIQPDGFFIKEGWEEFILQHKFDYIGAPWRHYAGICNEKGEEIENVRVNIGNGGFSCRKIDKMKEISSKFAEFKLLERGSQYPPPEDLFCGYFSRILGYNLPTVEQANSWSLDPIDLEDYLNKKSFGFHCPKMINEWKNVK